MASRALQGTGPKSTFRAGSDRLTIIYIGSQLRLSDSGQLAPAVGNSAWRFYGRPQAREGARLPCWVISIVAVGWLAILNWGAVAEPKTDRHGDPLREGAIARLGTVRFRTTQRIVTLTFSPDGKQLVTGGDGGAVSVWDFETGRPLRQWTTAGTPPRPIVRGLATTPDGKGLVTADRDG